jgi:hypothetical protein
MTAPRRRILAIGVRRGRSPWVWRVSLFRYLLALCDGGSWRR